MFIHPAGIFQIQVQPTIKKMNKDKYTHYHFDILLDVIYYMLEVHLLIYIEHDIHM